MFKKNFDNNLEYYISDLFPEKLKHCFTTRRNGNTPPPLDGFSIGTAQFPEYKEFVEDNRKKISSTLNMDYSKLVITDQQHTDNIFVYKEYSHSENLRFLHSTDAVITNLSGIPFLLFFADCTPILLYDKKKSILGLIHAGWKGTAKRIAYKTAKKMVQEFESNPSDIVAAIGPAIGKCCYEVSLDVFNNLKNTVCDTELIKDEDFSFINKQNKYHIDLKTINKMQLEASGVIQIDILDKCTSCDNHLFFSHRKSNGITGRHGLIAQIN